VGLEIGMAESTLAIRTSMDAVVECDLQVVEPGSGQIGLGIDDGIDQSPQKGGESHLRMMKCYRFVGLFYIHTGILGIVFRTNVTNRKVW
jgi:hypothetical protein